MVNCVLVIVHVINVTFLDVQGGQRQRVIKKEESVCVLFIVLWLWIKEVISRRRSRGEDEEGRGFVDTSSGSTLRKKKK